jgi:uncharacterized protein YndB with AHSA1/START domain
MPTFDDSARSEAPPEEVWKLLYDPARFTDWWEGFLTTEVGDGEFVFVQEEVPDFPIPHQLEARREEGSVVISCLLHDLEFAWRLEPLDGGEATRISVHVEIPESEMSLFDRQQSVIRSSIQRLAELAAGT